MSATAESARSDRLKRLKASLGERLSNPTAALETLVTEVELGDSQAELWEQLHAAAGRDGQEQALGDAYTKMVGVHRFQRLGPLQQAEVFLHAADFYQGIVGDPSTAERYLRKVVQINPGHVDAFQRLERRFDGAAAADVHRRVELYALVAHQPPKSENALAAKAASALLSLTEKTPLSDDACKRLVALVPANVRLLKALETHCRITKRNALLCTIMELALVDPALPEEVALEQRRLLIERYMAEGAKPAGAISHVEELLEQNPSDPLVRRTAERLLGVPEVAARAATALQKARRNSASIRVP
jgi:hypothetical protein